MAAERMNKSREKERQKAERLRETQRYLEKEQN